jgi:hypothetical protein
MPAVLDALAQFRLLELLFLGRERVVVALYKPAVR